MANFNRNDPSSPMNLEIVDSRFADPLVEDPSMPRTSAASRVGMLIAMALFIAAGGYWFYHVTSSTEAGQRPLNVRLDR